MRTIEAPITLELTPNGVRIHPAFWEWVMTLKDAERVEVQDFVLTLDIVCRGMPPGCTIHEVWDAVQKALPDWQMTAAASSSAPTIH